MTDALTHCLLVSDLDAYRKGVGFSAQYAWVPAKIARAGTALQGGFFVAEVWGTVDARHLAHVDAAHRATARTLR